MALIALAADKGSPGVTTAAVAIAAVWPRRVLLAEVDPAGGDLVYRGSAAHGGPLDPNTGMLSIGATARRGLVPDQLWDHAQPMLGGLDVLVGLGSSEQSAGLAGLWPMLGRAFAGLGDSPDGPADVIADCGRVGADAVAVEMFPYASIVLLVAGTEPEQLARVRDRAAALSARLHGGQRGAAQLGTPLIGVLLVADVGSASRLVGQVNDMLVAAQAGARVVGVVARDTSGADQLAGRKRGRLDKSLLIRSARKVVGDLHQQFGAAFAGAPAGASTPGGARGGVGGAGRVTGPRAGAQPAPSQPGQAGRPAQPLPGQSGQSGHAPHPGPGAQPPQGAQPPHHGHGNPSGTGEQPSGRHAQPPHEQRDQRAGSAQPRPPRDQTRENERTQQIHQMPRPGRAQPQPEPQPPATYDGGSPYDGASPYDGGAYERQAAPDGSGPYDPQTSSSYDPQTSYGANAPLGANAPYDGGSPYDGGAAQPEQRPGAAGGAGGAGGGAGW
ncbi:hypothetical protein OYE22_20150 [Streptomyces sp. 71268]|nr:hypothetical protein [Streptomyces sp. 71268]WEV27255.1 hypothetical protein OYE22_20150 [Streptomyces sp. 71268]